MAHVLVINWDPAEAGPICDRLRRDGFEAAAYPVRDNRAFHSIAENPPSAVVIDLMRMPSYGRIMGALLRERKSTRMIPLVFIAGDPEKTARVRKLFPDAVVANLLQLGAAVNRAIRRAPDEPVVPGGWGTTVSQKLKIGEGAVVALMHAPEGFEARLELPESTRSQTKIGEADVVLVFVKSAAALGRELPELSREMRKGRTIWLVWPKKAGSVKSNLSMPRIREMCGEVGLVDYKVCALDETWSGMAVGPRRTR
jgi:hypothetical protein